MPVRRGRSESGFRFGGAEAHVRSQRFCYLSGSVPWPLHYRPGPLSRRRAGGGHTGKARQLLDSCKFEFLQAKPQQYDIIIPSGIDVKTELPFENFIFFGNTTVKIKTLKTGIHFNNAYISRNCKAIQVGCVLRKRQVVLIWTFDQKHSKDWDNIHKCLQGCV